jgi:hypothetical protein
MLAEVLAVSENGEDGLSVPEGIKRQLQNSSTERAKVIRNSDKALLQYLLLGLDCDTEWDKLPKNIRSFLLKRACGESSHVSDDQLSWIGSVFCRDYSLNVEEYVSRCNLGATLTMLVNSVARALEADYSYQDQPEPPDASYEKCIECTLSQSADELDNRFTRFLKRAISWVHHTLRQFIKFISVSLVADPEFQRELDYAMLGKPWIIRWPVTFFLIGVWIYCKTLQQMIFPLFLVYPTIHSTPCQIQ